MALTADDLLIKEGSTPTYLATLKDENDAAVQLSAISALTLTLFVEGGDKDGTIINSRSAQDVLNDNNVTVGSTTGLLTWSMQTADTAIQDTSLSHLKTEQHRAVFVWTLTNGKVGVHELPLQVQNVRKIGSV